MGLSLSTSQGQFGFHNWQIADWPDLVKVELCWQSTAGTNSSLLAFVFLAELRVKSRDRRRDTDRARHRGFKMLSSPLIGFPPTPYFYTPAFVNPFSSQITSLWLLFSGLRLTGFRHVMSK